MPTLRIRQQRAASDEHHVVVRLEGDGVGPLEAETRFAFELTREDRGDIRWYLEDFPE